MLDVEKTSLISVLIPCYNGEKYLKKCLAALLGQTYKNIEVIIVDDGSKDNSDKIIKDYIARFEQTGKRLIYLCQENAGQAAAINVALKHMHGEYFVWQDVDDFYEQDGIENLYSFLKNNTEYNFVRGKVRKWELDSSHKKSFLVGSKFPEKRNIFSLYLFEKDAYCFPGIFMLRTKYFDKCVRNRNIYESMAGQNWQLILPVAYRGKCGYLDKVVYNYVIHDDSHSHLAKCKNDRINRYNDHKDILIHVINSIGSMGPIIKHIYIARIRIRYLIKNLKLLFLKQEG